MEIVNRIAKQLGSSLNAVLPLPVLREAILGLVDGYPLSVEDLAGRLGWYESDVRAAIEKIKSVGFDSTGKIVSLGVSLVPTSHSFEVNGRQLYTWCALDALLFPIILGRTALVGSLCPATATPIHLEIGPFGISKAEPETTVVSLAGQPGSDVRKTFCNHVNFFTTREAAIDSAGAIVLTLEEAFELARAMLANWPEGDAAGCGCC